MSESDDIPAPDKEESSAEEMTEEQIWSEFGFGKKSGPAEKQAAPDDDAPDDADDAGDGPDDTTDPSDGDDAGSRDTEPTGKTEDLAAQNARLEHLLNSQNGRLNASAREIADLKRRLAAATSPKDAPGEKGDDPSKERKERLDAVKEEFPDIAGPMAAELEALHAEIASLRERDGKKAETDRQAAQSRLDEIHTEQWQLFTDEHPDGLGVIEKNAEAFRGWIEDQPKRVRDLFAVNSEQIVDGAGAALVVTKFKQALAETSGGTSENRQRNRRQRQLDGARNSSGSRVPASTGSLPDDADPQALWKEMRRNKMF